MQDIVTNLEEMDFQVESSHHEIAPGQHEIDLGPMDALRAADQLLTFKMTAKRL